MTSLDIPMLPEKFSPAFNLPLPKDVTCPECGQSKEAAYQRCCSSCTKEEVACAEQADS